MKKLMRFATIISIALLSCFILNGCGESQDLSGNCGYYTEDGDIMLDDTLYKALPECEQLYPPTDYWAYSDIMVSEKKMPLVMIPLYFDEYLFSSLDGNFLFTENAETFFCKEEIYEDIVARIEAGFSPTDMCYSYDAYSEEEDIFYTEYYTLNAEEQRVIKSVLSTITPSELKVTDEFYYDWMLYLEDCSSDLYFKEYSVDIAVDGNRYYIISYPSETETLLYRVPDTYAEDFEGIMKTYIDAEEIYWEKNPEGGYDYNDKED